MQLSCVSSPTLLVPTPSLCHLCYCCYPAPMQSPLCIDLAGSASTHPGDHTLPPQHLRFHCCQHLLLQLVELKGRSQHFQSRLINFPSFMYGLSVSTPADNTLSISSTVIALFHNGAGFNHLLIIMSTFNHLFLHCCRSRNSTSQGMWWR